MSRTGTLGRLFGHVREPTLQMHPQDMATRRLKEGDLVHLSSKRGAIVVPLEASTDVALSQVYMAMHWGEEFISGRSHTGERLAGVNSITSPAVCPDSKQPELKHATVKVSKADLPWTLLAMAWLPADSVLSVRAKLQSLMGEFAFCSCVPFSNGVPMHASGERQGVLLRAADHAPAPDALLSRIEGLLGLAAPDVVRYQDARRGQRRALRLKRQGDNATLDALLLAGDTSAQTWLRALLQEELPAQGYGHALLTASAQAPVQLAAQGKVVCTCFNVRDSAVSDCLKACTGTPAVRLAQLQSELKCGTNCGSCIPQLQRMVQDNAPIPSRPQETMAQTSS
jgi:assimilatory nitrate reductase catalytic subunit